MTSEEFAAKIKEKYPQYQNMDNPVLIRKVLEKYPDYASQIQEQDPQSMVGSAWESLGEKVPGLSQAGEFVEETVPGEIAETAGAIGSKAGPLGPIIEQIGTQIATPISMAGSAIPRTVGDVSLQLAASPVSKAIGVARGALRPATKWAGNVGRSLLARDIGVAEPFIENVQRNPEFLKKISNDPLVIQDHIKRVGEIMGRGLGYVGKRVEAIEDKFLQIHFGSPKKMPKITLDDLKKEFKFKLTTKGMKTGEKPISLLDQYGKQLPLSEYSKPVSRTEAIVGKDADVLREYIGELGKYEKDGATFNDLMNLRRRLGEDIFWHQGVAPKVGTQANRLLTDLRSQLNKRLYKIAPELEEADAVYSTARKSYDKLSKKYFGDDPEKAYNRVKLMIQRGYAPETLLQRAGQINASTEKAMSGLINKISAMQFAPYVRKGIAGGFMGFGLIPSAVMFGPGMATADLAALIASSPRAAAMGIRVAPYISEAASTALRTVSQNSLQSRAIAQAIIGSQRNK